MLLETNNFYEFGDFRLDLAEKVLLRDGKFIPVTPKVFETLLVLVENAGRIIEKDELMQKIWQDRFVEESNLTFNIKMLRKALGDDATNPRYVETVPRRGYRFIADVKRAAGDELRTDDGYKIHSSNGHATNGHTIKSNGTNGVNGNSLDEKPNAETPPVKVSPASGRRIIFYSLLTTILIGVVAVSGFFLTRKQPTFYERFGSVNNNSGLLSVEKLSDTGNVGGLNISPDGKLLVYYTQENGKNTIWLRQLGSGNSVPILTTEENIVSAGFSRAGEYISYAHQRKGELLTLSRVSTFGGAPTRIISGAHSGYTDSPDEREIAFVRYDREQGSRLMIADADGRNERQVLLSPKPHYLFGIDWSPDGKSIAYCIGSGAYGTGMSFGIYELDIANGTEKSLSDFKWHNLENIEWLPDRSGLLVSGREKPEGVDGIWRMSYPDGQVVPVTDNSSDLNFRSASADFTRIVASQTTLRANVWVVPKNDLSNARSIGSGVFDLAWTPDGKIVFPSKNSVKTDIWLTGADGADKRQLTASESLERSPEVSPDGRFIVFASTQTGRQNIWRMNADGSNQMPLTNGDGETFPVFTPDGRWIVYTSNNDKSLWRVPVEGGASEQLSAAPHRRTAISPDGTKLAYIGRVNNQPKLFIESFPDCAPIRQYDTSVVNEASLMRVVWTQDSKSVIYFVNDAAWVGNLWQQSLDDGVPQKITNFTSERIFDFAFSRDESHIAFVRGDWSSDAVLLKGFK